ncbi:MAG: glycosyltransferase family 4 protein [Planctomycetota bacterium JB042]
MAETIRTLHVDTERTWRGGEQQAVYLAAGLAARGHATEVAGPPGSPYVARAREAGLVAHEVRMRGEVDPVAMSRLARILRRGRFDLVHAHTSHAHTLAAAAGAVAGVPCVVSRRVDFELRRGPLNRFKYRHGVARYVAISRAVRDVLVRGGADPDRVRIVPSGIDPSRLEGFDPAPLREEFGIEGGTRVVGALGHFAWHKGFETLVDAAPLLRDRVPRLRIFLVGDGELRDDLRARAGGLADDGTIVFPGFRPDAPAFLRLFDVLATPSVMEGLNTTNLDALALGRPVVASAVGGIPEAVIDGESGLLVPPEDPAALANAVARVLEDPDLAARLGAGGRRIVAERFTVDAMVEGNLRVYRELTAREAAAGGNS